MAKQAATNTPTALASLTADTWYTIQNRGNVAMWVQESTAAPTDNTAAFTLAPSEMMMVKRTSATNIYVWQPDPGLGGYGTAVYNTGA